ncbi:MAG: hypothetical protein ABF379_02650 [Akkermansiaceae bacterium]
MNFQRFSSSFTPSSWFAHAEYRTFTNTQGRALEAELIDYLVGRSVLDNDQYRVLFRQVF